MSDTPRTEIYVLNPHPECVPAAFARELEREIIKLKQENAALLAVIEKALTVVPN